MTANHRVLVVDDRPMNLAIMKEALDEHYEIALAEDGTMALAVAPSFQPDVVLLDVMMPGRDGFDVCRTMKRDQSLKQARVIMVSAKAELAARLQGYDAGADDYVTKPFREEELLTKISFAIRTKRLENLCGPTGEVLALISELRDTNIDPCMLPVRALARLIACELRSTGTHPEIDEQFLDDLHHASALRDVGMLAVPEIIREKVHSHTTEEIEQLKQHTLVGGALLSRLASDHPKVSLFRMASEVARSHHEHFDGSGYPDRLVGSATPLAARILNIADSYIQFAIDGESIFSEALKREACDTITNKTGTVFDPELVEVLPAALGRLDELMNEDESLMELQLSAR